MFPRIHSHYQDGSNFDAIQFELEREKVFDQSEQQYFEPNYEIDSDKECFGCLYRVWDGRILLGTFYQKQKKWIANPYYQKRKYLRLEQSLEKSFNSNEKAISHIICSYEG